MNLSDENLPWDEKDPYVEYALLSLISFALKNSSNPLIYDIGAHNGNFTRGIVGTLPATASVVMFEADPRRAGELARCAEVFAPRVLDVVNKAVWWRSGVPLGFVQNDGEASHLNALSDNDVPHSNTTVQVETICVDDYIAITGRRPDMLKIDVEGAEIDVIIGALGFIKKAFPPILFEENSSLKAAKYLAELGYRVINAHTLERMDCLLPSTNEQTLNLFAFHPSSNELLKSFPEKRNVLYSGSLMDVGKSTAPHVFETRLFKSKAGNVLFKFNLNQDFGGADLCIEYLIDGVVVGRYGGPAKVISRDYSACMINIGEANGSARIRATTALDLENNQVEISLLCCDSGIKTALGKIKALINLVRAN